VQRYTEFPLPPNVFKKNFKKNVFYQVWDRLSVPINTHTPY
jgi:hypothetical protein